MDSAVLNSTKRNETSFGNNVLISTTMPRNGMIDASGCRRRGQNAMRSGRRLRELRPVKARICRQRILENSGDNRPRGGLLLRKRRTEMIVAIENRQNGVYAGELQESCVGLWSSVSRWLSTHHRSCCTRRIKHKHDVRGTYAQ